MNRAHLASGLISRLVVTGLVCWAVAGTAYSVLRLTFGYRPVVHVRWAPTVDDGARFQLEQRYTLARPGPKGDRTFSYALTDRSPENIRNIVLDPFVEDTHRIDRSAYQVESSAPRLPYVTPIPGRPVGLEYLSVLGFLGGLASIGLALLTRSRTLVHLCTSVLGFLGGFANFGRAQLNRSPTLVQWIGVLDGLLARKQRLIQSVLISEHSLERAAAVTAIAAGVAALVAIAARTGEFTDDTYIYFNYAKNLVAGRPFAYDPRNIASEGFTSVIYLLLLVPFEAAGINMMFAAVILNLAAIALILYLIYRVLRVDRVLEGGVLLIAVSLFASFMARDTNIPTVVGLGLETMLGPASVLWAILHLARVHQADDEATRRRAVTMFLAASFLSFLIRPENIVLLAAAGVLILVAMWRRGQLAALLVRLGTFVAALVVYFAGKLILFGDLMQTSYYRKMRFDAEDGSGREYVIGALNDYWRWILYAVVLAVCAAGLLLWRRRERGWNTFRCLAPRSSVLALAVVAGGNLMVFLPSEPLVGYAYRYLVNFYVFLYLIVAVGAAYLLSLVTLRIERRVMYAGAIVTGVVSMLWAGSIAAADTGAGTVVERLRLYTKAEETTAQHGYIRLGEFLRDRIPDIEELTLVFGDAGVFPYVLGSRFVDANGLTEPYLARLFREPNGPEKARKFADYVLSWQPDIIIVAFGEADDGRWVSRDNIHSPFLGPTPMSVFRAYRDYGVGYVCTAHAAYYDLHFGVRQTSKYFEPASAALLEYCGKNGLVLDDGLAVTLDGEEVHFPRLTP